MAPEVAVREYNEARDKAAVEQLEWRCEAAGGQRGKPSLVTDLMGDPLSRVRHFSSHIMLVAHYGEDEEEEIVGVIRGCIKHVTRGNRALIGFDACQKLAYILGLRVSSSHRRLGIGSKLVEAIEEWSRKKGAQFAYMASDCKNQASINLFIIKFNYTKFQNPTILAHPLHPHYKLPKPGIVIIKISPQLAQLFYRRIFAAAADLFPKDIDLILDNDLNLGTFMALPEKSLKSWEHRVTAGTILPPNFAILSIWNTNKTYKLQVKGVSAIKHACCIGSRKLHSWMPWLRLSSIPNIFRKFGFYFLYGLHMEGKDGPSLMKALWAYAHNLARDERDCEMLVTELGRDDPVREAIPHWRRFSLEDVWCVKRLMKQVRGDQEEQLDAEMRGISSSSIPSHEISSMIFVDPRDF